MQTFRKKPVTIQAIQWDGSIKSGEQIAALLPAVSLHAEKDDPRPPRLSIVTLEGVMIARVGDWIIQGVAGEVYPCKPDIFAATYEPMTLWRGQTGALHEGARQRDTGDAGTSPAEPFQADPWVLRFSHQAASKLTPPLSSSQPPETPWARST